MDPLRSALAFAIGIAVIVMSGGWVGWVIVIVAAADLAIDWRIRAIPPVDPLLLADVDETMGMEKTDPAGADKLLDRALDDAEKRKEQLHADLFRRAKTDRRAAVELRNRLRYELKLAPGIRKKAEGWTTGSSRVAALREIDRQTSETQKQLARVEQLLGDYPYYMEWRDEARDYLRSEAFLGQLGDRKAILLYTAIAVLIVIVAWRAFQ